MCFTLKWLSLWRKERERETVTATEGATTTRWVRSEWEKKRSYFQWQGKKRKERRERLAIGHGLVCQCGRHVLISSWPVVVMDSECHRSSFKRERTCVSLCDELRVQFTRELAACSSQQGAREGRERERKKRKDGHIGKKEREHVHVPARAVMVSIIDCLVGGRSFEREREGTSRQMNK